MKDMDCSDSSTELEPLIIQEEDGHPDSPQTEQMETKNTDYSGFSFSAAPLKQSGLMRPYLQEMDELLKSCEELTGFTMDDTIVSVTTSYGKMIKDSDRDGGLLANYFSTDYIDTRTENKFPGVGSCSNSENVSLKSDMPLTSAGNKLSDNLVEYEGRLLGMLAMLESSMEETGVDFEKQVWPIGQECVHISKTVQSCMDNTEQYEAEEMSQNDTMKMPICDLMDVQTKSPVQSMPVESRENSQELSKEVNMTSTEGPGEDMDESEAGAEILLNSESSFESDSDFNELTALRNQFDKCIENVRYLEEERRNLVIELLKLLNQSETHSDKEESKEDGDETEEQISNKLKELFTLMKNKEVVKREKMKARENLREERTKEEQGVWKVTIEREGLQAEHRSLKKRLFTVAWECAQSQVTLRKQHSEVELLHKEKDKLKSMLLQLTEESSQLKSSHLQQLLMLKEQFQITSQTCSPHEIAVCKRHSCGDIQLYLKGGLHALEERYEPILMALLKRRESTTGALVKAKEEAKQLKVQVRPLKEAVQQLEFQRVFLEEKLKLTVLQRREELGQYKETLTSLEERSRELKTELMIQRRKRQDIEEIKERLTQQLLTYRATVGEHNTCDRPQ